MVDQFLTGKVVVAFKMKISTNSDLWKDSVKARITIGRAAERRTVQGGGLQVLPGEIISTGEFEVPLTTDVIETVNPPVNPDSLSFWMKSIIVDGIFPVVTMTKVDENQAADIISNSFTSEIIEIVPGDKEEGADEKVIVRFIPTIHTSFIRT